MEHYNSQATKCYFTKEALCNSTTLLQKQNAQTTEIINMNHLCSVFYHGRLLCIFEPFHTAHVAQFVLPK